MIEQDEATEYNGSYHFPNTEILTPIESLMSKSNFCEISDGYMLIPNCSSELFDDGTMPLDEIHISKLYSLFKRNVLDYYDWLKDEYNTPLKIKRFKESADYKYKEHEMQQEANCILGTTYYLIRNLSTDEYYDLNSHTFTIQLPNALNGYDLYLKRNDSHFGTFDFKTTPVDEDTAYKIETNSCNIIIFVRFTGETRIHGVSEQSICEPIKVIIADSKSGDIYFEYAPVNDISNPTQQEEEIKLHSDPQPVEEMPIFDYGERGVYEHIRENIKICKHCQKKGLHQKIIVNYEVLPDCTIRVLYFNPTGCEVQDKNIKDVIESIKVTRPAIVNGKPVKTRFRTPINLFL